MDTQQNASGGADYRTYFGNIFACFGFAFSYYSTCINQVAITFIAQVIHNHTVLGYNHY